METPPDPNHDSSRSFSLRELLLSLSLEELLALSSSNLWSEFSDHHAQMSSSSFFRYPSSYINPGNHGHVTRTMSSSPFPGSSSHSPSSSLGGMNYHQPTSGFPDLGGSDLRPYNHGALCYNTSLEQNPSFQSHLDDPLMHDAIYSRSYIDPMMPAGCPSLIRNPSFTRNITNHTQSYSDLGNLRCSSSSNLGSISSRGGRSLSMDMMVNSKIRGSCRRYLEMMNDKKGSQEFFKLLDKCDQSQKEEIVHSVVTDIPRLIAVAKTSFGASSVINLITAVQSSPQLCMMVTTALDYGNLELMLDEFGYLVIKYRLYQLNFAQNMSIVEATLANFHSLMRFKLGCFVIQDSIKTSEQTFYIRMFLDEVLKNCIRLAQDPHANYVLKLVIELEYPGANSAICSALEGDLVLLSRHINASHVIEKCLTSSAGDRIIEALLNCERFELEEIALDQCGNYVLQTALQVTKDNRLGDKLSVVLSPHQNHPLASNVWRKVSKGSRKYRA